MDFKKYLIVLVFFVVGVFIGKMLPTNTAVDNTAATSRTQPSTVTNTNTDLRGGGAGVVAPTYNDLRGGGAGVVAPTDPNMRVQDTDVINSSFVTPEEQRISAELAKLPQFSSNISFGMKNNEVFKLQKFLTIFGYLDQSYNTGYYGTKTFQAVKDFQRDNNISQVGQVGPITVARMNSLIKGPLSLPTACNILHACSNGQTCCIVGGNAGGTTAAACRDMGGTIGTGSSGWCFPN